MTDRLIGSNNQVIHTQDSEETEYEMRVYDNMSTAQAKVHRQCRDQIKDYAYAMKTGGIDRKTGRPTKLSIQGMLESCEEGTQQLRDVFSADIPSMLERAVSSVVMEAAEPLLGLTSQVFTEREHDPSRSILQNAIGSVHASRVAEGQEYPEISLEIEGDVVHRPLGKIGCASRMSWETLQWSAWDVWGAQLRLMSNAVARLREIEVATVMDTTATTLKDNAATDNTLSTLGRNSLGQHDSTIMLDDIAFGYRTLTNNGYEPNSIAMHPSMWACWFEKGLAAAFGFESGRQELLWQTPTGNDGSRALPSDSPLAQRSATTVANVFSLKTVIPLFPSLKRVVLSSHLPYTASDNKGSIFMFKFGDAGLSLVDPAGLTQDQWEDPSHDMVKLRMRLFCEHVPMNQDINGLNPSLGVFKSVRARSSHHFLEQVELTTGYFTGSYGNHLYSGTPNGN